MSEETKYCTHHKCEHPVSEFGANRRMKDGLNHYCLEANREIQRQFRERVGGQGPKYCHACKTTHPANQFGKYKRICYKAEQEREELKAAKIAYREARMRKPGRAWLRTDWQSRVWNEGPDWEFWTDNWGTRYPRAELNPDKPWGTRYCVTCRDYVDAEEFDIDPNTGVAIYICHKHRTEPEPDEYDTLLQRLRNDGPNAGATSLEESRDFSP